MSASPSVPRARAAARPDDAFIALAHPYQRELHAHCYRMLGSLSDADDAMQETLLRAWRGYPSFQQRSTLRTWLFRIATNACLRALERQSPRVLSLDALAAADPLGDLPAPRDGRWLDPYPTVRAADPDTADPAAALALKSHIELAFVAALQHLSPRQRAVYILRAALDYSARETADLLDVTPAAVHSAMQRARRALGESATSEPAATPADRLAFGDQASAFADAWQRHDVAAIVAMLTADARLRMPPLDVWFDGSDAIGSFLTARALSSGKTWRLIPTVANEQPAFGAYLLDPDTRNWTAYCLIVLSAAAGRPGAPRVAAIDTFLRPDLFARFELPQAFAP